MSIRDRIWRLAKSNLNNLLEKAADGTSAGNSRLEDVTDAELEAELNRRRRYREEQARIGTKHASVNGHATDRAARERLAKERTARVEVERQRRAKERAKAGPRPSASRPRPSAGPSRSSSRSQWKAAFDNLRAKKDPKLAKCYQVLEVQYGAEWSEVKTSYRRLMRKYHPDFHRSSPEKHKAATEVSQALTDAYNYLEKEVLGGPNRGK